MYKTIGNFVKDNEVYYINLYTKNYVKRIKKDI